MGVRPNVKGGGGPAAGSHHRRASFQGCSRGGAPDPRDARAPISRGPGSAANSGRPGNKPRALTSWLGVPEAVRMGAPPQRKRRRRRQQRARASAKLRLQGCHITQGQCGKLAGLDRARSLLGARPRDTVAHDEARLGASKACKVGPVQGSADITAAAAEHMHAHAARSRRKSPRRRRRCGRGANPRRFSKLDTARTRRPPAPHIARAACSAFTEAHNGPSETGAARRPKGTRLKPRDRGARVPRLSAPSPPVTPAAGEQRENASQRGAADLAWAQRVGSAFQGDRGALRGRRAAAADAGAVTPLTML